MITLYDTTGAAQMEIAPEDSSVQTKALQGENVLSLSWTHWDCLVLDVGWWTEYMGERYYVSERYHPEEQSSMEWKYNVQLQGVEGMLGRFLVLETTDGNAEPVFTLTAPPVEHVRMIVSCLNRGMGTADWKVGRVDGTDLVVMDYEGTYADAALKQLAEKTGHGVEYWVDGMTVNLCRCELGEQLTMGYGNGLTGLQREATEDERFYTRLFVVGSSRNIDPSVYGRSRLTLPDGEAFVEVGTAEYGIHDRYEKDAFAHIFPRRTGTASGVRSEELTGDDGKTYTRWKFRDEAMDFDPNDCQIAGTELRLSWQTGDLKGLGEGEDYSWAVTFESKTREYTLEPIYPYKNDEQLPGGSLVPRDGDRYILWGIRMPESYYPAAEQELAEAVRQYNEEHWRDKSVYKGQTDHVWMEETGADLYVGRRVRLESREYFPTTGYRDSRVTKLTRRVNLPGMADLEISDALQRGTVAQIHDSIDHVESWVKDRVGSVEMPDIIRTGDRTKMTDHNVLSALRSLYEFLSKTKDDRAKGKIIFERGAEFGKFVASLHAGSGAAVDPKGNAEVESLRVRSYMEVMELIINRLSAVEGDQLLTEGDTIEKVEDLGGGIYGLWLKSKWEGYFTAQAENNVIKGIVNTLAEGSGTYYTSWLRVNYVNTASNYLEAVLYPDDEVPAGRNFPPVEMMHIARWGHQTDPKRQSCLYLSSTEGRMVHLTGVNKPIIDRGNYGATFGSLPEWLRDPDLNLPLASGQDYIYARGVIVQDIIQLDYQGKPVSTVVDRGPWQPDGTYYCETRNPVTEQYEQSDVWHTGCRWRCLKDKTTTEPRWDNTDWALVEGDTRLKASIDGALTTVRGEMNACLTIRADYLNTDVTERIPVGGVLWTRYSEDADGNPRPTLDNEWALRRAGTGTELTLTAEDVDYQGNAPSILRFTASVRLREGAQATATHEFTFVAPPLKVEILTGSGGSVIINGQGNRTLYAHVWRGTEEVTDSIPAGFFSWTRISLDAEDDKLWNRHHEGIGPVLTVSTEDVYRNAVFCCEVIDETKT